ncbi:class I SAM-dependent methyltransferase [Oxalobacter vibrioformis]|uniref:Class I SAM-dependent methyltransferase n=1 Tax=Oxalobacter vibrioformis TaxID=933080 RepID=A0A9E9LZ05_9BURK|nr:class I SAM-dependent methyltransferase [Oxalobacter vibrioformis]WAW09503.1 class I SAM-dependent methyltransferase [Oxalobacter vibrioformis]
MRDYSKNPEGRNPRLPGFSIPIQALFIQLIAFCLTLFMVQVLFKLTGWMASTLAFGLIQGALAALITYVRRMPYWWLPIQLVFPVAMFLLLALQISPVWYLGAFFILLLLFWGAIVTRVPLYLSGHAAWEAVEELLPKDRPLRVIDIGSGLGGLVLYLAAKRPDCSVSGIELSPFLWMVSRLRQKLSKTPARFRLGNYEKLNLAEYDVVFAYLSPVVMDSLWVKTDTEMRPGSLFLSLEFEVEDIDPDIRIAAGNRVLFGWVMGKTPRIQS